ncbi:MAG TPA: NAD(P)H-hydrate dehydratase [Gemmatimonadaceae bacterium]|nr:NAD(P)H-hydrate dehydratase [Gemmatimonadaceae bacterium]
MPSSRLLVRVVSAAQAAARDAAAMAGGTPSATLMDRAGTGTAHLVLQHFNLPRGARVLVLTGAGNNGGDGWVVARELAALGADVHVCEVLAPKSRDAIDARERARREGGNRVRECALESAHAEAYAVVVDALLGTGATGAPRGAILDALQALRVQRERGAGVVAVDLPTGLDATSGDGQHAVPAQFTVTYGTVKRGHLISRGICGHVAVLDIGLGAHAALADDAPLLVDEAWVAEQVPVIHADAHKGTRGKLVIVGGGEGMSGAVILAARAALRSGAGMVKVLADARSLDAVRAAEPAALTGEWPESDAAVAADIAGWADAVAIGPGLGNSARTRALVERVLTGWRGPVLMDADALNVFAGSLDALARLLSGRAAVLTPHAAEFARLASVSVADVLAQRFEIGVAVARQLGAAVLLKGTPTVVFAPDGRQRLVSASGTPALATGGSGDVLSGIIGTLIVQLDDPTVAAACGAWVHGRAAELAQFAPATRLVGASGAPASSPGAPASASGAPASASGAPPSGARRDARGVALDDVVSALRDAWRLSAQPPAPPLLAELPAVEVAT